MHVLGELLARLRHSQIRFDHINGMSVYTLDDPLFAIIPKV